MTKGQVQLCERLKRLGFARESRLRLYGTEFELLSDPILVGDNLVFVDAIDRKSGILRRIRIPLTILSKAKEDGSTA